MNKEDFYKLSVKKKKKFLEDNPEYYHLIDFSDKKNLINCIRDSVEVQNTKSLDRANEILKKYQTPKIRTFRSNYSNRDYEVKRYKYIDQVFIAYCKNTIVGNDMVRLHQKYNCYNHSILFISKHHNINYFFNDENIKNTLAIYGNTVAEHLAKGNFSKEVTEKILNYYNYNIRYDYFNRHIYRCPKYVLDLVKNDVRFVGDLINRSYVFVSRTNENFYRYKKEYEGALNYVLENQESIKDLITKDEKIKHNLYYYFKYILNSVFS